MYIYEATLETESADVDVAATDGASVSLLSAQSSQPVHSLCPTTRSHRPPPTTRTHATTAKAKIRSEPGKCALLLPRRRSPSQKRTSRRGRFLSNISSSDSSPKILTAERIGVKDCLLLVHVLKIFTSGGPIYRRLRAIAALRVRSPTAYRSI